MTPCHHIAWLSCVAFLVTPSHIPFSASNAFEEKWLSTLSARTFVGKGESFLQVRKWLVGNTSALSSVRAHLWERQRQMTVADGTKLPVQHPVSFQKRS